MFARKRKSIPMTPEEAQKVFDLVKANDIQIVDLKFNDLPGLWQHFSMPVSELTEMDDLTNEHLGGRRGLRRLQHPRLSEDPGERHDPHPGSDHRPRRPRLRDPHSQRDLRHLRPADPQALQPRPPLHRQEGRGVPPVRLASPTPATGGRSWSSSSSTTCDSTRTSSAVSTTSTPSRGSGTAAATRSRTWATSRASRKATSRCRLTTPCRTSAPR